MSARHTSQVNGDVHPDFQGVADLFGRILDATATPGGGAALAVYHRGEPVVDVWGGEATPGNAWREDNLAMCFSTSKGVAATALHIAADRGLVDYDVPVCAYWPDFGANRKTGITVRHVLSHGAGLQNLRGMVRKPDDLFVWDRMLASIAAAPAAHAPGRRHGYHALTFGWIVGGIVEGATGRPFTEFVREEIVEPLGLDGASYGVAEHDRDRIAALAPMGGPFMQALPVRLAAGLAVETSGRALSFVRSPFDPRRIRDAMVVRNATPVFWDPAIMDAVVPSANGFFTARSLARVYAMLSGGGVLDGQRLLSESTVEAAGRVQTRSLDSVIMVPMRWRLGYHMVATNRGVIPRAFGHFGFGGSGAWADPMRDVAVAFVPNRGGGTPMGDMRLARLNTAVLEAVSRARRSSRGLPTITRRHA